MFDDIEIAREGNNFYLKFKNGAKEQVSTVDAMKLHLDMKRNEQLELQSVLLFEDSNQHCICYEKRFSEFLNKKMAQID